MRPSNKCPPHSVYCWLRNNSLISVSHWTAKLQLLSYSYGPQSVTCTARWLFNKLVPRIFYFQRAKKRRHWQNPNQANLHFTEEKVAQKNKLILSDGCAEFLRAGEFSAVVAVGCGGGESRGLQHSLLPQCWHKAGLLLITITGG